MNQEENQMSGRGYYRPIVGGTPAPISPGQKIAGITIGSVFGAILLAIIIYLIVYRVRNGGWPWSK